MDKAQKSVQRREERESDSQISLEASRAFSHSADASKISWIDWPPARRWLLGEEVSSLPFDCDTNSLVSLMVGHDTSVRVILGAESDCMAEHLGALPRHLNVGEDCSAGFASVGRVVGALLVDVSEGSVGADHGHL